jgi:hypothetical protein
MSTTVVTNKVQDPSGAPLVGVAVRITLETNTAGLHLPGVGSASSTTQPITVFTDPTGTWSTALTPNAEIMQPVNSYYQVSEGGYLSNIVVPVGGGPYLLDQLLTGTPPTPAPQYVQSPAAIAVADAGTVAGTRPEINLIPGAGMSISAVDNPGATRVDVTLTSTGGVTFSGTVQAETGYGISSNAGVAATASRGDHTHGSPALGTTGATAAAGNDSRIVGAAQTANNLSDLTNAATARTNLGLGNSATENVGTGPGTVAAGNDSRITGALQAANNLSDVANAATARTNLGLGNSATENVGTGAGTVAAGNDSRITGALQAANNLSDVANAGTARTNLGLGNSATENVGTTAGTVAAGDDSRITGAQQRSTLTTKGDLYVATASATTTRLGVGADGQALFANSANSDGVGWATPELGYYPPDAYGFVGMTSPVESATVTSSAGNFLVRIYVPAGVPIAKVANVVTVAGTWASNGNPSGFAVYDDSGNQLGVSADLAGTVWTATGWGIVPLTSTIAAQSTPRYVRVLVVVNGWTGLSFLWTQSNNISAAVLNGGAVTNYRSRFQASTITSFPASVNPATYGVTHQYMPLVGLTSS